MNNNGQQLLQMVGVGSLVTMMAIVGYMGNHTANAKTAQQITAETIPYIDSFDESLSTSFYDVRGDWMSTHGVYQPTTDDGKERIATIGNVKWDQYAVDVDVFHAQDGGIILGNKTGNGLAFVMRPKDGDAYFIERKGNKWKDTLVSAQLPSNLSDVIHLRVTKDGDHVQAYLNGTLLLEADYKLKNKGVVGLYSAIGATDAFDNMAVTPLAGGDPLYTDSFQSGTSPYFHDVRGGWMIIDGEYAPTVDSGKEPIATVGNVKWDQYAVDVNVLHAQDGGIILGNKTGNGLAFVMRPKDGDAYFIERKGNKWKDTLVSAQLPSNLSDVIHLRVTKDGDHVQAYLNGTLLLETDYKLKNRGVVGLYSAVGSTDAFDNLKIRSLDDPDLNPTTPPLELPKDYTTFEEFSNDSGNWSVNNGSYTPSDGNTDFGFSTVGDSQWGDMIVETTLTSAVDGGVVLHADDAGNGLAFVVRPGQGDAYFQQRSDGAWGDIYYSVPVILEQGQDLDLRVEAHGDTYRGFINGKFVLEINQNLFTQGKVGFYSNGSGFGQQGFTHLSILPWSEDATLSTEVTTPSYSLPFYDSFQIDYGNWRSEGGTWQYSDGTYKPTKAGVAERFATVGDNTWEDYDVEAEMGNAYDGGIVIGGDSSRDGYVFVVKPYSDEVYFASRVDGQWVGSNIGEVNYDLNPGETYLLGVKVQGSHYEGYINDVLVTSFDALETHKGRVGLYLNEDSSDQWFDNLRVLPIEKEVTEAPVTNFVYNPPITYPESVERPDPIADEDQIVTNADGEEAYRGEIMLLASSQVELDAALELSGGYILDKNEVLGLVLIGIDQSKDVFAVAEELRGAGLRVVSNDSLTVNSDTNWTTVLDPTWDGNCDLTTPPIQGYTHDEIWAQNDPKTYNALTDINSENAWGFMDMMLGASWGESISNQVVLGVVDVFSNSSNATNPSDRWLSTDVRVKVQSNGNSASSKKFHGAVVSGIINGVENCRGMVGVMQGKSRLYGRGVGRGVYSLADDVIKLVDEGAEAINLSVGYDVSKVSVDDWKYGESALEMAVAYAWQKGTVLVVAAGNDNRDLDLQGHETYPLLFAKKYDNVVGVGGLDYVSSKYYNAPYFRTGNGLTSQRLNISNYGSLVQLAAPGNMMSYDDLGKLYQPIAGTSFSAPMVTGGFGLLRMLNPDIHYKDAVRSLVESGRYHMADYNIISGNNPGPEYATVTVSKKYDAVALDLERALKYANCYFSSRNLQTGISHTINGNNTVTIDASVNNVCNEDARLSVELPNGQTIPIVEKGVVGGILQGSKAVALYDGQYRVYLQFKPETDEDVQSPSTALTSYFSRELTLDSFNLGSTPSITLNDQEFILGDAIQVTGDGITSSSGVELIINDANGNQIISQTGYANPQGKVAYTVDVDEITFQRQGNYSLFIRDTSKNIQSNIIEFSVNLAKVYMEGPYANGNITSVIGCNMDVSVTAHPMHSNSTLRFYLGELGKEALIGTKNSGTPSTVNFIIQSSDLSSLPIGMLSVLVEEETTGGTIIRNDVGLRFQYNCSSNPQSQTPGIAMVSSEYPNKVVSIVGKNFTPSTDFDLRVMDSSGNELTINNTEGSTNTLGSISTSFLFPQVGMYTVELVTGGVSASQTISITDIHLAINPSSAMSGNSVGVTADNLPASSGVFLYGNSGQHKFLMSSLGLATDTNGTLSTQITLLDENSSLSDGNYQLSLETIIGGITYELGTTAFTITSVDLSYSSVLNNNSVVTISGSGATPNTQVTGHVSGNGIAEVTHNVTTDGSGNYTVNIDVSALQPGVYDVWLSQGQISGPTQQVTIDIAQLIPNIIDVTGPARENDSMRVLGDGASPSSKVTVIMSVSGTDRALGKIDTDAQGAFNAYVPLVGIVAGTYDVWVVDDATGGESAHRSVDVLAVQPSISLSSTTMTENGNVTLTGATFTPGGQVDIFRDYSFPKVVSVTANSDGTLPSTILTYNASTWGPYDTHDFGVYAYDQGKQMFSKSILLTVTAEPSASAPTLTLSGDPTYPVYPNDYFRLTAKEGVAGSHIRVIAKNPSGEELILKEATSSAAYTVSYAAYLYNTSDMVKGVYTVWAEDVNRGLRSDTVQITLNGVNPRLTNTPTTAVASTSFNVQGDGAYGGGLVIIYEKKSDGTMREMGSERADDFGNFSVQVTLFDQGDTSVVAYDNETGKYSVARPVTVAAQPVANKPIFHFEDIYIDDNENVRQVVEKDGNVAMKGDWYTPYGQVKIEVFGTDGLLKETLYQTIGSSHHLDYDLHPSANWVGYGTYLVRTTDIGSSFFHEEYLEYRPKPNVDVIYPVREFGQTQQVDLTQFRQNTATNVALYLYRPGYPAHYWKTVTTNSSGVVPGGITMTLNRSGFGPWENMWLEPGEYKFEAVYADGRIAGSESFTINEPQVSMSKYTVSSGDVIRVDVKGMAPNKVVYINYRSEGDQLSTRSWGYVETDGNGYGSLIKAFPDGNSPGTYEIVAKESGVNGAFTNFYTFTVQ